MFKHEKDCVTACGRGPGSGRRRGRRSRLAGADHVRAAPYVVGNINGQNGWSKTGPYDAAVAAVSSFPAASGYGFGTQALRISNAVVSGSFGDQTFAPPLANAAGGVDRPEPLRRDLQHRHGARDAAARTGTDGEP